MKRIISALLVFTMSQCVWAVDVYKYWDWGHSPARENYEFALLERALEASSSTYGPYRLERIRQELSTNRVRREINNGDIINVRSGPYLPVDEIDNPAEANLPVPVPIMQNLLGYRNLVVHTDMAKKFNTIQNITELKAFSVGLARGWIDVDIFRENHFVVDDSANVTTLFDMLELKRFDFFPSSILALESDLEQASEPDLLVAVADLIVVLPFPVIFYVPAGEERLAERLATGLQIVKDNGDIERLLQAHFAEKVDYLKREGLRTITLHNPLLPNNLQVKDLPYIVNQ